MNSDLLKLNAWSNQNFDWTNLFLRALGLVMSFVSRVFLTSFIQPDFVFMFVNFYMEGGLFYLAPTNQ